MTRPVVQLDNDMVRVRACAKVNLALSVGPPVPMGSARAGWHPICSWMHAIDLADEIELRRQAPGADSVFDIAWAEDSDQDGGASVLRGPIEWPVERDLGVRAHAAMQALHGRELPVAVRVRKRIPAGGGLGGGSADAAAVLLGLDALFGLRTPGEELARVAMGLGSDVGFFVDREAFQAGHPPRPAIVSGFGERVERLPRAPGAVVLAMPAAACPTPAVYAAFDARATGVCLDEGRVRRAVKAAAQRGAVDASDLFNDLAEAAESVAPEVGRVRTALGEALGRPAFVTGSGSTVFALAHSGEDLTGAVERARAELDPGETAEWARQAIKALGGGSRFAGLMDGGGVRARVVGAAFA